MSKLILPINDCAFSAGYKNAAYLKQQGYAHYGVDLYSISGNQTMYACGEGTVTHVGDDGLLGNVIVIVYRDVELHSGEVKHLSCRMFHFDKIYVKVGDKVTKDSVIGLYGNTGRTLVNGKAMGKHLHIEFDIDTEYPQYAVGIKASGNVIRRGTVDSTIDPSEIWYLDKNQSISGIYEGWYTANDVQLPRLEEETKGDEQQPTSKSITLDELGKLLESKGINQIVL